MTLAESPPWSPSTNLSLSDSAIAVEPVDDAWIIVRMDGVTIGCWDGMRRVAMMVKNMRRWCKVAVVVEGIHFTHSKTSTRARLARIRQESLISRKTERDRDKATQFLTSALNEVEKDHIDLLRNAVKGDGELLEKLRKDAEDFIKKKMVHVLELLKAVKTVGEIPPRFCDVIMSTSDQMASYILTAVMTSMSSPATYIDASKSVDSSHYESANPEFYSDVSNHLIYSIQTSNTQGSIPIITGCFGPFPRCHSMLDIHTTTYATALATLLSSRLPNTHELWLINDGVDAIFTADPLIVPDAVPLKCLTAEEAVEMSIGIGTLMMGGKDGVDEGFEEGTEVPVRVIGMKDAEDAFRDGEVWMVNGGDTVGGTLIVPSPRRLKGETVRDASETRGSKKWTAVVYRKEVTVYRVKADMHPVGEQTRSGLLMENGNAFTMKVLPRVLEIVESHHRTVCGVVTGFKSVSVVVAVKDAEMAVALEGCGGVIEEDMDGDSGVGTGCTCEVGCMEAEDGILGDLKRLGVATMEELALVTLVGGAQGDGMELGRLVEALKGEGVNVEMCVQVLGGCGISVAVDRERVDDALRLVHRLIFCS